MTVDFPDDPDERNAGIARSGLVLTGILLVATNLRASITTVGPLAEDVQKDLSLSATDTSFLITLPLLVFAVVSPLGPALARKLGIEQSLVFSLGVLAFSIVLRSLPWAPGLWIGTIGIGASIAMLNVLLPPWVKRDFPHDVGRVTGFYASAQSGMAALASAFAVPIAASSDAGWRLSFGVWSGLALISLGLLIPIMKSSTKCQGKNLALPRVLTEAHGTGLRVPWKSRLGWAVALYSGLQALFYFTVLTWWPTIERENGFSQAVAGFHQGIWQVVGIAASLLAGMFLHRIGSDARAGVLVFAAPVVVGIAGQLLWPLFSLFWVVLIGLGIGGTFVVSISLIGLRTQHPLQTAQLSALVQVVGYSVAAVGPVVAGALAQVSGTWASALIFLLTLQVIQILIALYAAKPGTI